MADAPLIMQITTFPYLHSHRTTILLSVSYSKIQFPSFPELFICERIGIYINIVCTVSEVLKYQYSLKVHAVLLHNDNHKLHPKYKKTTCTQTQERILIYIFTDLYAHCFWTGKTSKLSFRSSVYITFSLSMPVAVNSRQPLGICQAVRSNSSQPAIQRPRLYYINSWASFSNRYLT